jgi:hypothetical protein
MINSNKSRCCIMIFDFQSHGSMHLNFNEGYLRTLRHGFPDTRIVFHGGDGQVAALSALLSDADDIEYSVCSLSKPPLGFSRQNQFAARFAAYACSKVIKKAINKQEIMLVALLGEDAGLYDVVGLSWSRISSAPLHMILHNHLGDTMVWRSRNPFFRALDLVSLMRKPLPRNVKLIALELGIRHKISVNYPAVTTALATLEHPMLPSEWGKRRKAEQRLRIGFLGNASKNKGFDCFVATANACQNLAVDFYAVGIATTDSNSLDLSNLKQKPAPGGLARASYVAAVQELDIVCLPLKGMVYDYVASGSVTDAIASLKPLIAIKNSVLDSLFSTYGDIGVLVESEDDMVEAVQSIFSSDFAQKMSIWQANLLKIRSARRPEVLSAGYAALLV